MSDRYEDVSDRLEFYEEIKGQRRSIKGRALIKSGDNPSLTRDNVQASEPLYQEEAQKEEEKEEE